MPSLVSLFVEISEFVMILESQKLSSRMELGLIYSGVYTMMM